MRRAERIFVELNQWIVIALLVAMSGIVFANVSLRYLTNFSITWAEEVARYLMIWMVFLGAGLVLRAGGHVAITNLQDAMAPRIQIAMRILVALSMLGFFAVMIWFGNEYMNRMGRQLTPATRIPFKYIYMAMPLGFGLLIVHFLLVARGFLLGQPPEDSSAMGSDMPAPDARRDNGGRG